MTRGLKQEAAARGGKIHTDGAMMGREESRDPGMVDYG